MNRLSIDSTFTKGHWKDKTVRQVADKEWYKFKSFYEKYPFMWDDSVDEYVEDISAALSRNRKSLTPSFNRK